MIVADLSLIPMGSGTSASKYIKAVYDLLQESGINFKAGAMSTSLETKSFEELFSIVEGANRRLADMGVKRIVTKVNIDCRLDKEISMETKLRASKEL
jgi:uncharacterized protein (TIGR00106 family)